jgi:bis(5'-nucleosyl)-tetraphosphatase (symmetrical)
MTTYAIGDIQGCHNELQKLLEKIHFDPNSDTLWLTGDLVNRGPKSLEVLRFVHSLGDSAVTVLGNHDLHLLALWQHQHRHFKSNETLAAIFTADDRDQLLEWLRHRPLMHYDTGLNVAMLHAGLPPQWGRDEALTYAAEVEAVLRGPHFHEFLGHMYGNKPACWSENLSGWDRLRFIVNCFTRLRFCTLDGKLDFKHKGHPDKQQSTDLLPWYRIPQRKSQSLPIVFGHWSTLGLHQQDNVHSIDTGCLWGGELSALKLEDGSITGLACPGHAAPGRD